MLLFVGAIVGGLLIGVVYAKVHVPAAQRLPRVGAILLGFAGAMGVLFLQPDEASGQQALVTLVAYALSFLLASTLVRGILWHRLLPESGRTLAQTIGRVFLRPDEIYDEWMLFLQSEVAAATAAEESAEESAPS
ncbi:hypothetical protein CLV85_0149 [Salinibacterium amurskyense]|uniref:Uncharacterized protein n=1 Tax=Salinibacterium amurskyense TaxID=205941 RepID=A0A2M9D5I9_9MICO|nr:hypothetical protein [Salinibacterium amurskyense]PJJ80982.1 hypothetical protein CLV85_0149 [Salinibacterium amurskyense]RLQ83021.1 hypothetical protein D9C83_00745 [Salinibacterium amurskyense]GHD81890.1 hypothetical protein GCM10007394_16550 [Salinibacterium amurskyense]